MPTYPSVKPRSRAAWRAWLTQHHETAAGVWLVMAKKHTGLPTVAYSDAVEEALCFGWIDTTLNPIDERFYKQLFTPRNPKGTWAASNKARVERLIAAGMMTDAGLAAIETAKKNGSWTTLDDVEAAVVPRELQSALRARAKAKANWDAFSPSCRKQFLYWLAGAKRPETRAKRITAIADCAATGMTFAKFVASTTTK